MTLLLNISILGVTVAVIVGFVATLWLERSPRTTWVVIVSGLVLVAWAAAMTVLARRGSFVPPDAQSAPPIGISLSIAMAALALVLATSSSLRGMLSNQRNLIRLNLWRLMGILFLILMFAGRMPALWALPAGIGDILVGANAIRIARELDSPGGRRRAIIFNLCGMADLIVAVGLGIMTNPGSTQVFHTTPTSELATRFPLALVPTFLVPLAFMLHVVSLWQLLGTSWVTAAEVGYTVTAPTC